MSQNGARQPSREPVALSQKQRYISLLEDTGVPESEQPEYVSAVEAFLRALRPATLHALSTDAVSDYLERLCQRPDLEDEQVRRAIGALRLLLLQLTRTPAGQDVDWSGWLERRRAVSPETASSPSRAVDAPGTHTTVATGAPRIARAAQTFPILNELAAAVQQRRYSVRTEQSYIDWCNRFLAFCSDKEREQIEQADVQRFLRHLEEDCGLAPKTQSLAYNAVAFFFQHVLDKPLDGASVDRRRPQRQPPTMLEREEVKRLLETMSGSLGLMAHLLYGTGMRLMECVRLRVRDIDFEQRRISVRDRNGEMDRELPLPETLHERLRQHLQQVSAQYRDDLASGVATVSLPATVAGESPEAAREWAWQYVFPSAQLSRDPASGQVGRTHLHASSLQRALRSAAQSAQISTRVNAQALRDAFAIHVLESGCDIRTLQGLLGHTDIATTMRYARLGNRADLMQVSSPIDSI